MSRQTIILCIFAVLLQWQLWSVVSAGLAPPKGYSVGFKGTISKGFQKYTCTRGTWIRTSSYGNVISVDGSKLGKYWSVYNHQTRVITYYWNIDNSPGGTIESGHAISGLQASPVKTIQSPTSACSEYLAIIKVHRGGGDAAQVAFVSLTGTKGGLPPRKELCTTRTNGATSSVPFKGNFIFFNQDRQPPQVPASITPRATFLQTVFLEGKVMYVFARGLWRYEGIIATMSEVAGGNVLGKFGTVNKADRYGSKLSWQFKGPNGFWLSGQQCAKPVQLSADGCPWQLLKITTSGGTQSPLGPYKYVLMGATLGGLPPRLASRSEGMKWGAPFTGQCYLYAA